MPQALALALFTIGAPLAVVNGVIGIGSLAFLGQVVSIGLSLGVSTLLSSLLAPKPKQPRPEDVQGSRRQDTPSRIRFYGYNLASGSWSFGGSIRGTMHKVLMIGHGQINSVTKYFVDDYEVVPNASGVVNSSPFNGKVVIKTRIGLPTETAYPDLVAAFGNYTDDHRGDGIFSLYAQQRPVGQNRFNNTFPNSFETLYRVEFEGVPVRNLETDVVEYSNNAADCIFDYLTHPDGHNIPESIFTTPMALAGWRVARARCAELINLKEGGTEIRYALNGGYSLEERPADVLPRMLAVCDGKLFPTSDGGVLLDVGGYYEPTVIFGPDDIVGFSGLATGNDITDNANLIKAKFTNPNASFVLDDADNWVDEDDVVERGEIVADTEFVMCQSHGQTRRLMKLLAYRKNPSWKGQFTMGPRGLAAIGERLVRLRWPEYGIDHVFEPDNVNFLLSEEGDLKGVSMDLSAFPEEATTWNPITEEGTAPEQKDVDDISTIPTPDAPDLTVVRVTSGSTVAPQIVVDFDEPPVGLRTEIRYKKTADTNWTDLFPSEGTSTYTTPIVSDGVEYEVQVRYVSITGTEGTYSDSTEITPTADEAAPNAVTAVSATGGVGEVVLNFTTPNNANYNRTVIRRNTVNVEDGAVEVELVYGPANTATTYTDAALAAGDYFYWLSASNASGVESASVAAGVVTVT